MITFTITMTVKTSESIYKFKNAFLFPCLRLAIFSITNAASIFYSTQLTRISYHSKNLALYQLVKVWIATTHFPSITCTHTTEYLLVNLSQMETHYEIKFIAEQYHCSQLLFYFKLLLWNYNIMHHMSQQHFGKLLQMSSHKCHF